uniref:Uncharacterized protein n=1 Tax=Coccolithus braarudii TaxID=221442 RepID=A0A7S0PZM1_9EUKA
MDAEAPAAMAASRAGARARVHLPSAPQFARVVAFTTAQPWLPPSSLARLRTGEPAAAACLHMKQRSTRVYFGICRCSGWHGSGGSGAASKLARAASVDGRSARAVDKKRETRSPSSRTYSLPPSEGAGWMPSFVQRAGRAAVCSSNAEWYSARLT